MISGANENDLEIANAKANVLLSIDDDRQHLLGLIKYWREECFRYKKENEAYENMRKEAIDCINNFDWFDGKIPDDIEDVAFQYCMKEDVDDLLNILNKVGGSNEKLE